MSAKVKDTLIMVGAGAGVGLLVAGAELSIPVIAGVAVALTAAATLVKLATTERGETPKQEEVRPRAYARM